MILSIGEPRDPIEIVLKLIGEYDKVGIDEYKSRAIEPQGDKELPI